ncbi:MAG: hypothetical protein JXR73_08190 [Candidatus Omnitrophica bacterium]|nr:hypothetical protein [Candidatus Omnitrophota bacterium]
MRRIFIEAIFRYYYSIVFLIGSIYACLIVFLYRTTHIQILDNLLVFLLLPVFYASIKFDARKYLGTAIIIFLIVTASIYSTSNFNNFTTSLCTAVAYIFITVIFCEIIYRNFQSRRFILSQNQQLVKALEEAHLEIKAVREHLPICASCKRIRDKKGKWLDNEVFLMRYYGMEFTHSICPACMKKIYPDYLIQHEDLKWDE